MAREQHQKGLEEVKILVISEDKKSFPDYFEKVLWGFGFRFDRGDKLFRRTINEKPIKQISLRIKNITNPLKNIEEGMRQSDGFFKIYCVFDYLKNENDSSYTKAMNMKVPDNVVRINSVPSYEFWLLLHFLKTSKSFHDTSEVIKDLETEARKHLGPNFEYSKSKMSDKFFCLLEKKMSSAIKNAKELEKENKSSGNIHSSSSKIYQLIEHISTASRGL